MLHRTRMPGVIMTLCVFCNAAALMRALPCMQALTIAGEKMSKTEKISKHLDEVVKKLGQWSNDTALEARIRFKIKDLQVRPDPTRRCVVALRLKLVQTPRRRAVSLSHVRHA